MGSFERLRRALISYAAVVLYVASMAAAHADQLPTDIPPDWAETVAGNAYSLRAPAGTGYRPGQGIDSLVGVFAAPQFDLSADYGLYSETLTQGQGKAQYRERMVEVDGRPAKLVTAFAPELAADKPYVIGLHVPDVKRSILGALKLTLMANVDPPDRFATVERIFSTIRFLETNSD